MDPVFAKEIEFTDSARIQKTLEFVEDENRTLTLRTDNIDRQITLTSLGFDDAHQLLKLAPESPIASDEPILAGEFELIVSNGQEALHFTGLIRQSAPESDVDTDGIFCALPQRLVVVNKRDGIRLPFIKGMSARFRLLSANGTERATGRIVDLSTGGCQIELPIDSALLLDIDGQPAWIEITFPNEERLVCTAVFRYARVPRIGALARAGAAFAELGEEQRQKLWLWVREVELEIAARRGQRKSRGQTAGLFHNQSWTRPGTTPSTRPRPIHDRSTVAMSNSLSEVARQLSVAALAVRAGRALPEDKLYASAERLIRLLRRDRPTFLFALNCLVEQPPLVQHSIAVAGRLADLVADDDAVYSNLRDVVLGALIHDLGQIGQLGAQHNTLESIRGHMAQSSDRHIQRVFDIFEAQPDLDRPDTRCIVTHIHGAEDTTATDRLAGAARVVDAIDARMRGYYGEAPTTAFDVYKQLYQDADRFDPYWVRRYVQREGPYPIGSPVRYSNGFRAQIVRLDERGQPARVRVLRNLNASSEQRLNIILGGVDLHQLGSFDRPLPFDPSELYCRPDSM